MLVFGFRRLGSNVTPLSVSETWTPYVSTGPVVARTEPATTADRRQSARRKGTNRVDRVSFISDHGISPMRFATVPAVARSNDDRPAVRTAAAALISVAALGALGAPAAEAASPQKTVAEQYLAITKRTNIAGALFLYRTRPLLTANASGRKIYVTAVRPFVKSLRRTDTDLLALKTTGKTRRAVEQLVAVDRKTIRDLNSVAKMPASRTMAWAQLISNDENATQQKAQQLRILIG